MYSKPIVIINEELAEGIYLASGDTCYSASAIITQIPELGRGNYCIQINATHGATDGHTSSKQRFTLTFNQPVTYVSGGTYVSGNGTNVLVIDQSYWNNSSDNISFVDLYVESELGLSVPNVVVTCNP